MTHPDPRCAPIKAPATAYSDALLQRATTVVLTHRQASISLLQRHLKIGYSTALSLMDAMVRDNIVSQDIKKDGYRAILLSDRERSELLLGLQAEQIDDSQDPSSSS